MSSDSAPSGHYLFSIVAEAHPGAVERVLAPFSKRALTPRSVHLTRDTGLAISLSVDGLTGAQAAHISRQIGQIPGVTRSLFQMIEAQQPGEIGNAA